MKRAHHKLLALGPEVMAEVDRRFLAGAYPREVAEWLQAEGHFVDATSGGLITALARYRDLELRPRYAAPPEPATPEPAPAAPAERLDALAELEALAIIQKGRLARLLARPDHDALATLVAAEVRLLKDILADLADLQYQNETADA